MIGNWKLATGNYGYTLIEVLVGLAIISLLFTVGYAGYRDFAKRQVLNNAYEELKINLNSARQRALSGDKDLCNGTFLGIQLAFGGLTDRAAYQFYPKCSGGEGLYSVSTLPSGITVDTTSARILFKPVGQGTDLTSDATVTVKSATGERKIYITKQGTIK